MDFSIEQWEKHPVLTLVKALLWLGAGFFIQTLLYSSEWGGDVLLLLIIGLPYWLFVCLCVYCACLVLRAVVSILGLRDD